MKKNNIILGFLGWAILLFIVLVVSSTIAHRISVATGCKESTIFAQQIADEKKSMHDYVAKQPEEARRVGHHVLVAELTVHGITAVILASLIVWFRKDSGMPNTALEPTPTAP